MLFFIQLFACGTTSPVSHRADCLPGSMDFWRVEVPREAQRIDVGVDLVDSEAWFPPSVTLWEIESWGISVTSVQRGEVIAGSAGEDLCGLIGLEVLCPSFEAEIGADVDLSQDPLLLVHHNGCEVEDLEYTLTVDVDGEPAALDYQGNGILLGIDLTDVFGE